MSFVDQVFKNFASRTLSDTLYYNEILTLINNHLKRGYNNPAKTEEEKKVILQNLRSITDVDDDTIFRRISTPFIFKKKDEYESKYSSHGESLSQKKYIITDESEFSDLFGNLDNILKILQDSIKIKPTLLDEPLFIQFFTKFLNFLLVPYNMTTYNIIIYLPKIVELINKSLREKYIVIDCKEGISSYTCGRAIVFKADPHCITRIIIYNSVSEYNSDPDYEHISKIRDNYNGGYYNKYLKYKAKYLRLKSKIN